MRGATELGVGGVYISGCSDGVQPKSELVECRFLGAQTGATEIGAGGLNFFGCPHRSKRNWSWRSVYFWVLRRVQPKLELAECIFLGAHTGCS